MVAASWPTFRERAEDAGGLPGFVVDEVEGYLRCGILEHGVAHLACRRCGHARTDEALPDDHAPTLLMAGYWDSIVPLYTITPYVYALEDQDTEVEIEIVGNAAHQWTSWSPGWVKTWFQQH